MINKKILGLTFALFAIILFSNFLSAYMSSNPQTTSAGAGLNTKQTCSAGQDFLMQVVPFGCTPAVVRSDLLEENNVQVYCQLGVTQINPLIDVQAIDSVSFSGKYSSLVSGVGFHYAKSALGTPSDLNTPVLNNVGYVVINLKKQPNESAMPDYVSGNLSAKIRYNIKNAYGIGSGTFSLPEFSSDNEWQNKKGQYSFWDGKGFLKADSVTNTEADISVYTDSGVLTSVNLKKGETSNTIYLPGLECRAGLKLNLVDLESPDTKAQFRINANSAEAARGEKFLDNKCAVQNLKISGLSQQADIRCQTDSGVKSLSLSVSPKINLKVYGENKEVGVGDLIYNLPDRKIFLGYLGTKGKPENKNDLFVYLVSLPLPHSDKLSDSEISSLSSVIGKLIEARATSSGAVDVTSAVIKNVLGALNEVTAWVTKGRELARLNYGDETNGTIYVTDFAGAQDMELNGDALDQYNNAKTDYETIQDSYSSESYDGTTYGEEALYSEIQLANSAGQRKTALDLCSRFNQNYPNSIKNLNQYCNNYSLSNQGSNEVFVTINKQSYKISLDGIYEPTFEDYGAKIIANIPEGASQFDLTKDKITYLNSGSVDIYTLAQGWVTPLYFKYSGDWLWSPDKSNWMPVTTLVVSGGFWSGQKPVSSNQDLINSLVGKGLEQGKTILINNKATVEQEAFPASYIKLISLDENSAKVQVVLPSKSSVITLQKDTTTDFDNGYSFTLQKINLKKNAKVSIISSISNGETSANFSFKVGIEKRAIKLAPEQIKSTIKSLNDSIKTWSGISGTLGNVTTGLKTACLATGAGLVVKNFLENIYSGGAGISRNYVMSGVGGWTDKCASLVAEGKSTSLDKCFLDNADAIDSDVSQLNKIINSQNTNIKNIEAGTSTQFLTEKVVDTNAFMAKYSPQVSSYLGTSSGFANSLTDPSGKGETLNQNDILTIISDGYSNKIYSSDQLKEIELYSKVLDDPSSSAELKSVAQSRLYSDLIKVKTNAGNFAQASKLAQTLSGVSVNQIGFLETNQNVKSVPYTGLTLGETGKSVLGIDSNAPIYLTQTSEGNTYLFVLDNSVGTSKFTIKKNSDGKQMIYDYNSMSLVSNPSSALTNIYFQKYDSSSYSNKYKNAKVSYYETEPYKGLPAIVPIDVNKGWYASIKQTLPVGANIQSYDASGRVSSFYLCNVGANGIQEAQNIGDDTCEMINTGTGQPYNQFPGLSDSESKTLVNKAIDAIQQASSSYKSGLSGKISVLGQSIDVGSPAADIPAFQCQDFMSPKDCNLLFNVCDPVICPSSRCDLGGAYPVKDVIQTGIIGSIALCLPNAREGIIMPVCLTGVKAGIDGFLSVQNSFKDCLQESLNTGKQVGICDEVYSIYLCDFFWRQALPLTDMVIPKIVESLFGQNTRGGGEYLGVANAWGVAEKSVNYFTNYYGTNAAQAFNARLTEVGTEVCKSSISAVLPTGAELVNTLTKPDSPAQFTGRFDETPFTSATVPPTSHYKVFYHIYAGTDAGAYYQVYLKGDSGSSYYKDTSQSVTIDSGYVNVGGYATNTVDKIATSGYKQLCLNVNGQEECGFKEVSTSFAINYVKDNYLKSQAGQTDIKTESNCISGTANAYNLLNPNLQSGIESAINPSIYNEGIIRVCATDNPGKGTDPYSGAENSRWKEVGYCDNEKIKCWIDTQSIENVVKTGTVKNETLDSLSKNYNDILANQNGYLTETQFNSELDKIKNENDNSNKVNLINNIIDKAFLSNEKVQLYYLRGSAYASLMSPLLKQPILTLNFSLPATGGTCPTITTPSDIQKLSSARQKVLASAQKLQGTSASKTLYSNCWEAAYYVYKYAGVDNRCAYSDILGTSYTLGNAIIKPSSSGLFMIAATPTVCSLNKQYSNMTSEDKLNNIQSGDLLSYAWGSTSPHNAIFIEWNNKATRDAKLFDWNGQDIYGDKIFRYYNEILTDDKHPVYLYFQPVLLSSTGVPPSGVSGGAH